MPLFGKCHASLNRYKAWLPRILPRIETRLRHDLRARSVVFSPRLTRPKRGIVATLWEPEMWLFCHELGSRSVALCHEFEAQSVAFLPRLCHDLGARLTKGGTSIFATIREKVEAKSVVFLPRLQ